MVVTARAIYQNGQLRLLDPVEPVEGQTVNVSIEIEAIDETQRLHVALNDLVSWPDPTDERDAWVEIEAEAIDCELQGTP
jgi:predicted DNA-binding antitoxin AbrB/MazE fold protein